MSAMTEMIKLSGLSEISELSELSELIELREGGKREYTTAPYQAPGDEGLLYIIRPYSPEFGSSHSRGLVYL